MRIPYIADELNVDEAEVESLLVSLILDCKIDGRIDQVNKQLILAERGYASLLVSLQPLYILISVSAEMKDIVTAHSISGKIS